MIFAQAANAEKPFLGLAVADWAVLAVYFVVILAIGIWSMKKVKTMADFFMGGRRFGKVFMMFFAFGAGTSSEQAISVVAGTWRTGLAGIWWQFLWLWATPFYWIVAPIMRRMRALTTADFFECRYNSSTATLYSVYGIIMSIVFIAGGLYGSGKMVNALTGGELDRIAVEWNVQVPAIERDTNDALAFTNRQLQGYEFAIIAMTILFVTYGMAGGLGAAIVTDFIQGVLTITFSFLLLPFVFNMVGGWGALHGQAGMKEGMLDLIASADVAKTLGKEPITIFYVFMLSFTALAGIVVQPHIMGVCGAGKTEFEGRFGFTVGNFLKRFCTIAWTFTGLACIIWYLGDNSPLRHDDAPLTAGSGAAFADLPQADKNKALADFAKLPEPQREKITSDRKVYKSVQLHNRTIDNEAYAKLTAEEKEEVDSDDKSFADDLFGRAAFDILPTIAPGLIGLLLASLLAAVMSTSDAQMIISSGLFTENIYRRFFVRNASQSHYLWVGRFAGLIIVLAALVLQSTFTDVIDALKIILKTPAFIGISLWFGITWRRWNAISVWVSTAAGIAGWYLVSNEAVLIHSWGLLPDTMFGFKEDGSVAKILDAWQMVLFMVAGIGSGILVSVLTSAQSQEKLDGFYSLMHTPVTPGEHVESPCTLPEDPAPQQPKMFNISTIEIPKLTFTDLAGFAAAWVCVGLIIWLTRYLAGAA
jgi:Na+/proline symporter